MDYCSFIHPPTEWNLDCFQIWKIMSKSSLTICVQVFAWIYIIIKKNQDVFFSDYQSKLKLNHIKFRVFGCFSLKRNGRFTFMNVICYIDGFSSSNKPHTVMLCNKYFCFFIFYDFMFCFILAMSSQLRYIYHPYLTILVGISQYFCFTWFCAWLPAKTMVSQTELEMLKRGLDKEER